MLWYSYVCEILSSCFRLALRKSFLKEKIEKCKKK